MRPGRTGMRKAGWPTDRQVRRLTWFGCLLVAVGAVVAIFAVIFHPASHTDASAPARATHPAMERATPVRSASNPPVTWPVAGPVADLSVPLAGMPPVPDPANIYADAGPDMFSPAVRPEYPGRRPVQHVLHPRRALRHRGGRSPPEPGLPRPAHLRPQAPDPRRLCRRGPHRLRGHRRLPDR